MGIFKEIGLQEEGKDRLNEAVVYSIARAYSRIENHFSQFLASYGISLPKFNILLAVKHGNNSKGISQQAISKIVLVTTSNMTRMIDKLEDEGYVERIEQEGDRRVNIIKITKKASDLLDKIWPYYKKEVDNMVDSAFTKDEKSKVVGILEKFIKKI